MTQAPEHSSPWARWHRDYDDPSSDLSQRLGVVVRRAREALHALPPGPIRLISCCAGQGHDVVGALAGHPRSGDVEGRLVETVRADASLTDAYAGCTPADLLLLCASSATSPTRTSTPQ